MLVYNYLIITSVTLFAIYFIHTTFLLRWKINMMPVHILIQSHIYILVNSIRAAGSSAFSPSTKAFNSGGREFKAWPGWRGFDSPVPVGNQTPVELSAATLMGRSRMIYDIDGYVKIPLKITHQVWHAFTSISISHASPQKTHAFLQIFPKYFFLPNDNGKNKICMIKVLEYGDPLLKSEACDFSFPSFP